MTMPDPNGLYTLLMQNEARMSDDGRLMYTTLDNLTQEQGLRVELYAKIDNHAHLTNENVVDIIFDDHNAIPRRACIGDISRDEFERRFGRGLQLYGDAFERLADVFAYSSFPETYLHPQIARVLFGSGKLRRPGSAEKRVFDTAAIMLQAMGPNALGTMALVASSHLIRHLRGNENFSPDTVEFTLLTFSYFGAKRSGVRDEDWLSPAVRCGPGTGDARSLARSQNGNFERTTRLNWNLRFL